MIFNVFVMMTLFNEINMKKLTNTRNVFKGILGNRVYWFVTTATVCLQVILIQFGGRFFGTTPLDAVQWAVCVAFGVGTLIWHQIVICIPCHWIPNGDDQDDGVTTQIGAPIASNAAKVAADSRHNSSYSRGADFSRRSGRVSKSMRGKNSLRDQIVSNSMRDITERVRSYRESSANTRPTEMTSSHQY